MAYCRVGDGCDVYLYKSCDNNGDVWVFHLLYTRPYQEQTTLEARSVGDALRTATILQKEGYGIPDSVLDRLQSKM